MAVTKEFAVNIDTQLSEWYEKLYKNYTQYEMLADDFKWAGKYGRKDELEKIQVKMLQLHVVRAEIQSEIKKLDAIYRQDPWNRAFLVVSSVGHVHKDMYCSTCFDSTRYQWLVQYSNDDEATIVADAGQDACTVCYPSAPAEVLNRPSRIVTADKVAKAKAKAERDEKKAQRIAKEKANAPTASGEFLYFKDGKYTEVIKTERSAVSEWFNLQWKINREIVTQYHDGTPHSQESIDKQQQEKDLAKEKADTIAKNLAEKHGVSIEEQIRILENKYKKRGW